jgi:hypothetical protein
VKHYLRRWTNRPRPEDYLPFSTTHQHKQTWRLPFVGLAFAYLVLIVLVGLLLGQQAQFTEYVEDNREILCEVLEVQQQQASREFPAYLKLECDQL